MIDKGMIEVFKTDVHDPAQASALVDRLQLVLPTCRINFDLDDCDRILRIENPYGEVAANPIIQVLKNYGHLSEVLIDEVLVASPRW